MDYGLLTSTNKKQSFVSFCESTKETLRMCRNYKLLHLKSKLHRISCSLEKRRKIKHSRGGLRLKKANSDELFIAQMKVMKKKKDEEAEHGDTSLRDAIYKSIELEFIQSE